MPVCVCLRGAYLENHSVFSGSLCAKHRRFLAARLWCSPQWEGARSALCASMADPHFSAPQFGDSQQLRLVRILRSTVMVRVGGGWMALDEFLVKNDPCRGKAVPG